jgi:hypothetical protein
METETGKTRRARRGIEEEHQIAYFARIRAQIDRFPQLKWIHASMNGVPASGKASAGRRKASGQTSGVSDICIPVPMRGYHGAWIELKIKPNKLSPEQAEFLADMAKAGYWTATAWDIDELISMTAAYLEIDLR